MNMNPINIDYAYIKKAINQKKLPNVDFGSVGCNNDVIKLKNFTHMGGKNCILSSLNKTLRHYKINYSEEMLLGIASGLSMIVMQFQAAPFVGGLNAKDWNCLRSPLDRLGIKYKLHETGSAVKAHQTLKTILQKNQPAVTFVDMAFLPYFFAEGNKVPNENMGHFGGHSVVVSSIDEIKKKVTISDRFGKQVDIPLDLFQMARSSKYSPFVAKNKVLELFIEDDPVLIPLKDIIPDAIRQNVDQMLNPPTKMIGVSGFLKFKQLFPTWWKKYQGETFLNSLISLFIFMEVGGCGGAMFRDMYRIYLNEASEIMGNIKLSEAAEYFQDCVDAIHSLSYALLPDELEWMGKLRKSLLNHNDLQEKMPENSNELLLKLEKEQNLFIKRAIKENLPSYPKYIPKVMDAIQKVHDAENSAWKFLNTIY